jgi:hypothetical protein
MSRKTVFAALAGIALLVTGCGVDSSGVISGLPAPSGRVRTPQGPAASIPGLLPRDTVLYFVSHGTLTPVQRAGDQLSAAEKLALLVAGPTDDERAQGFGSEVPAGALTLELDPGPTVVSGTDVSKLSTMAVDQIVCTLADNGTPVTLAGGGQVRGSLTCPPAG